MKKLPEFNDLVRAYHLFFGSADGFEVLKDLMSFCKFRLPIENQVDEGKRQVLLHILEHSQLSVENLLRLYAERNLLTYETEPQDE